MKTSLNLSGGAMHPALKFVLPGIIDPAPEVAAALAAASVADRAAMVADMGHGYVLVLEANTAEVAEYARRGIIVTYAVKD
jgi:hypothetical protein